MYLRDVGIPGEGGRCRAPGERRTATLGRFPRAGAGDSGGEGSPAGTPRPLHGKGGVPVPDPLADALAPNPAQREFIRQAAETAGRYPPWSVEWGPAGFTARLGSVRLGPGSTQAGLEAELDAELLHRRRAVS